MAALFTEEKRDSQPTRSIAGFRIESTNEHNNNNNDYHEGGYESAPKNGLGLYIN